MCAFHPEASKELADMLFGDDLKKRDRWAQFVKENPSFWDDRQFNPLYEQRLKAYDRIKAVSDAKLFSIYDFINDPVNLFTCHEMLS